MADNTQATLHHRLGVGFLFWIVATVYTASASALTGILYARVASDAQDRHDTPEEQTEPNASTI